MANTTNFNWETPDDTDLVKDGAAAIRTLGSAIDTSLVDLKGGTTGQVLSKNSNTDMDFVWTTSDDANAIQNAIVDAKGDLISATAADTPARLAVGTNGQVLTADSAQATGLKWATVASGGLTLLNTGGTTLSTGTTTVSITPTGYTALKVYIKGAYATGNDRMYLRLNGDTGSNYSYALLRNEETNAPSALFSESTTSFEYIFQSLPTSNLTKLNGNCQIDIFFPADTDQVAIAYTALGGQTGSNWQVHGNGVYDSSAAITSLSFIMAGTSTFSGGTVYVYGVK